MKKKRLLSLTMAVALLFGSAAVLPEGVFTENTSITASAAGETSGDYGYNVSWSLSEDGVLTISGTGEMYYLSSAPSDLSPFYNRTDIKSVVIESGVTSIGDYAFRGCTSLTSVTIPCSVTNINYEAFYGCSSLTSITIPNGVTTIDDQAFCECSGLTSITIPDGVTSIGDLAFYGCPSLERVYIPNSVTEIDTSTFGYYQEFKDNVLYINKVNELKIYCYAGSAAEEYAKDNDFEYILLHEAERVEAKPVTCTADGNIEYWTDGDKFYSDEQLTNEITKASTVIIATGHKFRDWTTISTDTVNDTETLQRSCSVCGEKETKTVPISNPTLNNFKFENNTDGTAAVTNYTGNDETVVIPEKTADGKTITKIGDNAFESCSSLKAVTIPAGINTIEKNAFDSCTNLESVIIPDSVTYIEEYAFFNCPNLKSVTIPKSVVSIGDYAFGFDSYHDRVEFFLISCYCDTAGETYAKNNNLSYDLLDNNYETGSDGPFDYMELEDGTVELTKYNRFEYNVTIPSMLGSKKVTSIGKGAFLGEYNLTSLTIPDGVTKIGDEAFLNTPLRSLTIPDSVISIGNKAFYQTSLTSITIPQNVKSIGSEAFYYCPNLQSVTILGSVESFGGRAFFNCIGLKSISFGNNIKNIGYESFAQCSSLERVNIPGNIKNIDQKAFANCSQLINVTLEKGVETIGRQAFDGCFALKSIIMQEGVTSIGDMAFYYCSSLESLSIPSSVKSIGTDAFEGTPWLAAQKEQPFFIINGLLISANSNECTGNVVIPDDVTAIGNYAFERCHYIKEVKIPSSVKSIGEGAFKDCLFMQKITIPDSVVSIRDEAFSGCVALESIVIPDSVKQIGKRAFYNDYFNNADLGNGVEIIDDEAFFCCMNIKSIKIPSSVKIIGESAFANTGLTNVVIPQSVTQIGRKAFGYKNDVRLSNFKISAYPDTAGEKYAKNYGFTLALVNNDFECQKLEDGTFKIVKYIGNGSAITIPSTIDGVKVTSIGDMAFNSCESLTSVTIENGITALGRGTFGLCKNLKSVTIPESITSLDDAVFAFSGLTSVTIPKSVNTIGDNVFYGCTSLKSVSIPFGVESIGDSAFRECSSLKSLTIPRSVTKIGLWVFNLCDNLTLNVYKNSTAEQYAKNYSIKYELIKAVNSVRLAGAGRYATAVEISKAGFPDGSNTVVLAYGLNYADALAGVSLAKAMNAPILLTNLKSLPVETLAEIKRLGATNVVILGGTGAVGAEVEAALKKEGLKTERIAGGTRFETATKIAEKMQQLSGKAPEDIFFVYAFNSADALSVSAVAAVKGAPVIYLKTKGELDDATAAYLASVKGKVKNAYVIGGEGVISDDMMKKAGDALGVKATRVFGKDRFATCVAVNDTFKDVLSGDTICVATGMDFPDALAGGVFAALNHAPLFLINGKVKSLTLSDTQKSYLKTKAPQKIYTFGGTGAVPDSHVQAVAAASV